MEKALELEFEKNSLMKIDPRTKIFLTITVSTITIAGSTGGMMNIVRPCLTALPIILLLLSQRYRSAIRFTFIYTLLFLLEVNVLPMLHGSLNFALNAATGIYTHMLPGFIAGYCLITTTTVSEYVASMERMHMPQAIIIPVSVVFRFIPSVKEEYSSIRDAMKMRGITTLRSPMKMLEYRIVPLMMSLVKIGEELSAAALSRGLGSPVKRTNICCIGFGALDVVIFTVLALCWTGFFMN